MIAFHQNRRPPYVQDLAYVPLSLNGSDVYLVFLLFLACVGVTMASFLSEMAVFYASRIVDLLRHTEQFDVVPREYCNRKIPSLMVRCHKHRTYFVSSKLCQPCGGVGFPCFGIHSNLDKKGHLE